MSPAILNAERVYLSRTVVDFHRAGSFRGGVVGGEWCGGALAALTANEV